MNKYFSDKLHGESSHETDGTPPSSTSDSQESTQVFSSQMEKSFQETMSDSRKEILNSITLEEYRYLTYKFCQQKRDLANFIIAHVNYSQKNSTDNSSSKMVKNFKNNINNKRMNVFRNNTIKNNNPKRVKLFKKIIIIKGRKYLAQSRKR